MKPVTIFLVLMLVLNLFKDFNRDKKQHTKAKAFQFVCLLILTLGFSHVFSTFLSLFLKFDEVRAHHEVQFGILSGTLNLFTVVIHELLSVCLIIIVFRLALRKDQARKWLFYLVPVMTITQAFSFYRGFVGVDIQGDYNDSLVLFTGFIIYAGLASALLGIYNSGFMKDFFNGPVPSHQDTTDELAENADSD